jgi:hypothetical protein
MIACQDIPVLCKHQEPIKKPVDSRVNFWTAVTINTKQLKGYWAEGVWLFANSLDRGVHDER